MWGYLLQFIFGVLVLRWDFGSTLFIEFVGVLIAWVNFYKAGVKFVYGFAVDPPNICGLEPILAFDVIFLKINNNFLCQTIHRADLLYIYYKPGNTNNCILHIGHVPYVLLWNRPVATEENGWVRSASNGYNGHGIACFLFLHLYWLRRFFTFVFTVST